MTLGGVGISMVGRNPGSPSVASVVPQSYDGSVCRVPVLPAAWREADYDTTDIETVIQDLLTGQYSNPIRVVAFNTAERWSEDVSEDVARELRRRCDLQMRELPALISDFVERHEVTDRRQLTLRLI
jgi:hypothetical protein